VGYLCVNFSLPRRPVSWTDHLPTLPDIRGVNSIKVLGICFANHLSMNDHIHDVIGSCGQSLHALKVLRSHGMNDDSLRYIYKAVLLAKLLYVYPTWRGFTTAPDKQRIDAFVRRGVRLGLYSTGEPAPTQLINSADDALFERILHNPNHVLNPLLPDLNTTGYCPRQLVTTESYIRRLVACRVITF